MGLRRLCRPRLPSSIRTHSMIARAVPAGPTPAKCAPSIDPPSLSGSAAAMRASGAWTVASQDHRVLFRSLAECFLPGPHFWHFRTFHLHAPRRPIQARGQSPRDAPAGHDQDGRCGVPGMGEWNSCGGERLI